MLMKDKHSVAERRQGRLCTHETGDKHGFPMSQDYSSNELGESRGLPAHIKDAPEHLAVSTERACDGGYHTLYARPAHGVRK